MDSTSTCNTKPLEKDTENTTNSQNLYYLNNHFIKSNQLHSIGKLTAKKFYLIRLQHETATPASQK